ncbi:MAG: leucine-rich repeat domain-containing protein [Clostridia bacterium]|nr:leucine-rich repeat domain-containing protein [Clostridia bacterium]
MKDIGMIKRPDIVKAIKGMSLRISEWIKARGAIGAVTVICGIISFAVMLIAVVSYNSKKEGDGYRLLISGTALTGIEVSEGAEGISVDIPFGVLTIGEEAFKNNTAIKEVRLSVSVNKIEKRAFSGCSSLERVEIPPFSGLKEIENHVFQRCTAIKEVELRDASGLESIGYEAFMECTAMESVYIPKSVKVLGGYAFSGCSSLKEISFSKRSDMKELNKGAFEYCTALESVSLPEGVNALEKYSFRGCRSLKSVSFPKSLERIGENSFSGCPIENIDLGGSDAVWWVHLEDDTAVISDGRYMCASGSGGIAEAVQKFCGYAWKRES